MSDAIGLVGGAVRRRRGRLLRCGFGGLRGGGRIRGSRICLDDRLSSQFLTLLCGCGWRNSDGLGRNRDRRSGAEFRAVLIEALGSADESLSLAVAQHYLVLE